MKERLDVLFRLSKKYGQNETEILAFLENAQKELDEISKTIDGLGEKEKALKDKLDKAYAKKTNAQNTISECEQNIIAGRTYQDMGEELRDNAVQKVEDSKKTEESKWYNLFSW